MRYLPVVAFVLVCLWGPSGYGSVSEQEPNSPVTGAALFLSETGCTTDPAKYNYDPDNNPNPIPICTTQTYVTRNTPYDPNNPNPYGDVSLDPRLANKLPSNDELIGQLGGTRDFDWYYIDVTDPHQAVTPVYFSCDKKYGFYHEGFKADETPPEPYWTINYYYDPDSRTPEGLVEQSSYVVYKEMCKRGDAETKGPFRFQMNTERPGRYYIRIWGRYVGQRTEADAPTTTTVVQKQDDNRVYVTTVSSTGVELTVNSGGNSIQNKLDIGQSTTIGTVSVTLQSTTVAAKLNIDGTEVTIPDGGTQVVDGSTVKVSSVTNNIATVTITSGSVTETRTIVTDWIDSIAGKRVRLVSTTLEARLNVGGADRTVAQGDSFNAPGGTKAVDVEVRVKRFIDQVVVHTADYGLRLYTAKIGGELEPNDGMVEAYPLTSGTSVTAQLSSMYDQDWFSIDNDITRNSTKKISFYFNCKGQIGTVYILSAYDALGVLQSNYEVKAEQCNGPGGYSFTIDAPVTARYYFVVSSPTYTNTNQFTQSDYSVLAVASDKTPPPPDVPSRKEGDLEPNDKPVDAVPLPKNVGVTGQLATNLDQDWYYFFYDTSQDPPGATALTFTCTAPADSGAVYEISAYNPQNVLQNSYVVSAAQCSASGGFKFSLNTVVSGKYLLLVNYPAGSDPAKPNPFSQADYTLRWTPPAAGGGDNGPPKAPARLPGELEPNDTLPNAYPLTNEQAVTAQLASIDDLDYYYYDNDIGKNPSGVTPLYFKCAAPSGEGGQNNGGGVVYGLSTFNPQGVLQQTYTVGAAQCSVPGGFRFEMNTPATARYYLLVAGPPNKDPAAFSSADYTLSTFLNLAAEVPLSVAGNLRNAAIVKQAKVGRDSFSVKVGRCGTKKGIVKLTGSNLFLGKPDKNAQVKIQIGAWSCVSDTKEMAIDTSKPNQYRYLYPAPPPPQPPQPKRTRIAGG